ncbi:hypothetical protein Hanom_Chr03g00207601 [Helianthus anomalus]
MVKIYWIDCECSKDSISPPKIQISLSLSLEIEIVPNLRNPSSLIFIRNHPKIRRSVDGWFRVLEPLPELGAYLEPSRRTLGAMAVSTGCRLQLTEIPSSFNNQIL